MQYRRRSARPFLSARAVVTAIACAILMLAAVAPEASAQVLAREYRQRALQAVVMIIPLLDNGKLADFSGSGTIISQDGFILTNFHVVGDTKTRKLYKRAAVFMTDFADQEPKPRYIADVLAGDGAYDLAVLKISTTVDGKAVPAGTRFPAVPVGDSNALMPGDPIFMVGYPGISGATITFTSGTMSGWLGENLEAGGKQWIKTDGKIEHGNSGGAALNEFGELVAIPTAGYTDKEASARQNYLRPVSLAWALIGPNVPTVLRGTGIAQLTQPPAPSAPQTTTTLTTTAPQATTNSTPQATGALAWPPTTSFAAGQIWQVTLQGQAPFSFSVSGKDSDGDWTDTYPNKGSAAKVYTFMDSDSFVIQLTDGSGATLCVFDRNGLGSNTLTGRALYTAGKDSPVQNLNKSCTATLPSTASGTSPTTSSSTGAATNGSLAWPVLPTVRAGQTWTVTFQGVKPWVFTVRDQDKDGSWNVSAKGGSGDDDGYIAYYKDDDLLEFGVFTKTGGLVCDMEGKGSLKGTTLTGVALSYDSTTKKFTDLKQSCTAVLGTAAQTTTAPQTGTGLPGLPGGQQVGGLPGLPGSSATAALSWPINASMKAGQSWTVTFQGIAPWTVQLKALDKEGDWEATASGGQASGAAYVFFYASEGRVEFAVPANNGALLCNFSGAGSVKGNTLTGTAYFYDQQAKKSTDLKQSCTAQLR
ncbi:MAG TPA: serine protease [Deinococcales bacterium]|nr:serine protease [Deinococcales bacterium]